LLLIELRELGIEDQEKIKEERRRRETEISLLH